MTKNSFVAEVTFKKAKPWKADTLKIRRFSEFKIKLIILQ